MKLCQNSSDPSQLSPAPAEALKDEYANRPPLKCVSPESTTLYRAKMDLETPQESHIKLQRRNWTTLGMIGICRLRSPFWRVLGSSVMHIMHTTGREIWNTSPIARQIWREPDRQWEMKKSQELKIDTEMSYKIKREWRKEQGDSFYGPVWGWRFRAQVYHKRKWEWRGRISKPKRWRTSTSVW